MTKLLQKLRTVPTTGFFGWFHHHWNGFLLTLLILFLTLVFLWSCQDLIVYGLNNSSFGHWVYWHTTWLRPAAAK